MIPSDERGGRAGVKHDQGKPRMDLIPPELLTEVAKILTFGADKYDDRNWEKGMEWGRVYAALQRHLWAWWNKEDKDEETGESHLAHAACCISFLIAYEKRQVGEDTRYEQVKQNTIREFGTDWPFNCPRY